MAVLELRADITATVWKVLKEVGEPVAEDEAVMILESMKMEIPVYSAEAGVIKGILVEETQTVNAGAVLALVEV